MSSSSSPADYSSHVHTWQPSQVNTPPQYLGRKTLPIKRADAEPLTREDIQYDLLYFIFADPTRCFIDYMAPGQPSVNFCDLYVNSLFNSNKCSKVLKEKMVETPEFAIEFAKMALLTNVGRINTTMAFFPEMKTALRSYHPVPSLQKSDGNLQDAPRIKNCLKAALLPHEFKTLPPSTPNEIRERARAGHIPPTSVVNLIFVLANSAHAMDLAETHFEPPVEFLDLFLPINLSSSSRAQAFLWLIFHYLSPPDAMNPFDDDYSRAHPGKVPRMISLSREEQLRENQDPIEEIEWGRRMSNVRSKFLQELVDEMEAEKRRKKNAQLVPPAPSFTGAALGGPDMASSRHSRSARSGASPAEGSRASSYSHDLPPAPPQIIQQPAPRPPRSHLSSPQVYLPPPEPEHQWARSETQRTEEVPGDEHPQERTMLQQAWHVVHSTDPLEDSDQEADDHTRQDLSRRLRILSRLRGKDPTPPPNQGGQDASGSGTPQYQSQAQFQGGRSSQSSSQEGRPLRQAVWP